MADFLLGLPDEVLAIAHGSVRLQRFDQPACLGLLILHLSQQVEDQT